MYEEYNDRFFSITAEQAKEVELRQEKEFLVYYLRKALIMVGDMKISEAIAQLEKELEPKFEPSIMKKFYAEHCAKCGSQRCLGVYDEDWREGCKLYKEEFCK